MVTVLASGTRAESRTRHSQRLFSTRALALIRHTETKLQLARLIEDLGRARWLQVRVRAMQPVVAGEVLGIQDVERLEHALQTHSADGHGLRESDIELVVVLWR